MSPSVLGALLGALAGAGLGWFGARVINAGLDAQIARASPEDAAKFATIRRLAGPIVIATTVAEIAIVGYVGVELLAG
ncbi:hypothetical protein ACFQ4O_11870 [Methylopila musalis]|uniref:ATP synthase F(0) sector subunit c n=1 Tax=Methylopila musalis TaxID=1134781 RepID=A0ABW3Z8S9_9HYPH